MTRCAIRCMINTACSRTTPCAGHTTRGSCYTRGRAMSGTSDDTKSAPQIDVDDVAARNPNVDLRQLHEAQAVLRELRAEGVARATYSIGSPYERAGRLMRQRLRVR